MNVLFLKKNIYICYKNQNVNIKNNRLKSDGLSFLRKDMLFVRWNFSRDLTSLLSECLDYREIVRLNVLPGERLLKNHQLHACTDQSLLKQRPKKYRMCNKYIDYIYTSRLHKWFVAIVLLNFNRVTYIFSFIFSF